MIASCVNEKEIIPVERGSTIRHSPVKTAEGQHRRKRGKDPFGYYNSKGGQGRGIPRYCAEVVGKLKGDGGRNCGRTNKLQRSASKQRVMVGR